MMKEIQVPRAFIIYMNLRNFTNMSFDVKGPSVCTKASDSLNPDRREK